MTDLSRRALLGGCLGLATAPWLTGRAQATARPLFLSARADAADCYYACAFDTAGRFAFDLPLPSRGHAFAVCPALLEAILFARRPGTYAIVVDLRSGREIRTIASIDGRHFNGHGAYAADGRRLFVSETEAETGAGIIGIYDVDAGYRRIGEFPTGTLDPHEVSFLPDGRTLAVASGGLLTSPDAPRVKLNLDTMDPTLAYFDARDGRTIAAARPPAPLHRLSFHHIAVGADGTVAVAMQYEGASRDNVPLVGAHRLGEPELRFLTLPESVRGTMRNYCGAAAIDASGRILGISAPRGGLAAFWDLPSGAFLTTVAVPDGCGISSDGHGAGGFVVTSGLGGALRFDPRTTGRKPPFSSNALSAAHFDNHLTVASVA